MGNSNTVELTPADLDNAAPPARLVEHLKPARGAQKELVSSTSTDLATINGGGGGPLALLANVAAVTVTNDSSERVFIQFDGTAADDAGNGASLPGGSTLSVPGPKAELDKVRLFSDGTRRIGLIQFVGIA